MVAMAAPEHDKQKQDIKFYGGYQVYSESGVDLTLLRENLRRTPEQRWADACRGAAIFDAFRPVGKRPKGDRPMFDPEGIVRRLKDQGAEFVVIGGMAMIAHGSSYLTKDLDICYGRSAANLAVLATALAPLHPYLRGVPPDLPFRRDPPTLQAGLNFTLMTDLGPLDLLGEVSGVGTYTQVLAESVECSMVGMSVRVLSIDGLITAKTAAGRPKDLQHARELTELKKLRDAGDQTGGAPPSP
jgi:hypothetical protein